LKLIVITDAQFQEISAGRKPSGAALHSAVISGSSSEALPLDRGSYVLFFGVAQSGNAEVTYRVHYRYN
jgi:hypothetical protein